MKNKTAKQVADRNRDPSHRHWIAMGCGAIVLWLFFMIYLLRLDQVIGMVVDDGWYVLLSRALATGEGYQMINAPTPGIRPVTPPVFPALLAFCWHFSPDFPANIWLFKSVSIAAMLGAGLVAFVYFKHDRELPFYLSLGIAAATVFYPGLVFLATSTVMSECVFTFVQFLAIVVIERSVRYRMTGVAWRYAVLGGALASTAWLIRSAGAGLLVAAVLYLLKEHCPRQALIVGAIIVLSAGSWLGYARVHAPTPEQRAEQASSILQPYHEQFWQRRAGDPSSGTISAQELPARVWQNLSEIIRFDMGAVPFYAFYRAIEPGRAVLIGRPGIWISLALTVLAIVGFISVARARMTLAEFVVPLSLAITVLWGWEQFRFLLPLIPFLIFYQLMGWQSVLLLCSRLFAKPGTREIRTTITIAAWVMTVLNIYANSLYIKKQYEPGGLMNWHRAFAENAALLRYADEHLPQDAVLATQNPALVYLFTGNRTVAYGDPARSWEMWNRVGVRYLVHASPNPLPPLELLENKYPTIYRQSGRLNLRIVDLGSPSLRQAWGK